MSSRQFKQEVKNETLGKVRPSEQKQKLGEQLLPLIQDLYPDLAGKITDMLLENNNSELVHMLEDPNSLKSKVEEAVAVLQAQNCSFENFSAVLNSALTEDMLAQVPPNEQKQMLGGRLFPLIFAMHPSLAGKITDMLLKIDNSDLVHMLEHQESLKNKVEEAVASLNEGSSGSGAKGQGGQSMNGANGTWNEGSSGSGAKGQGGQSNNGQSGSSSQHNGHRETGIIEKLLHSYGFIQCCNGQAGLFFHFSQFDGNIKHLKTGDSVEFEMTYDPRTGKPIASSVSKIAPVSSHTSSKTDLPAATVTSTQPPTSNVINSHYQRPNQQMPYPHGEKFNEKRAEMLLRWKLKGKLSGKQQKEFENALKASTTFSAKANKLLSQKQQQHNGHNHGPSNNPRVQQSEKQFKCDFCDKTFTQQQNGQNKNDNKKNDTKNEGRGQTGNVG